jgi:uncharacterized membrane-anchored protein
MNPNPENRQSESPPLSPEQPTRQAGDILKPTIAEPVLKPLPALETPAQPPVTRKSALWFWIPLAMQAAIILALPLQAVHTQVTGKTLVLQTAPVDPYNLFRGYYVTLGYDISMAETLEKLPGGALIKQQQARTNSTTNPRSFFQSTAPIYIVLEAPAENGTPPRPWKPVAVAESYPTDLKPNQVALRGTLYGNRLTYGLENYYIPESDRDQINQQIAELGGQTNPPFVVEVKVDGQGQAMPISMWLQNQQYKF